MYTTRYISTTYIECWFGVESYYVKDKHISTYTHTHSLTPTQHNIPSSLVELFMAFCYFFSLFLYYFFFVHGNWNTFFCIK